MAEYPPLPPGQNTTMAAGGADLRSIHSQPSPKAGRPMPYSFNGNQTHSLGVEIELQIVDADSLALSNAVQQILDRVPKKWSDKIKPELMQSYCEQASFEVGHGRSIRAADPFIGELADMERPAVRPVSILPLGRLIWIVACVSAGLLGFEISLMRVLLVASWHHFAFLVIGVALLGFGASGTVLCIGREWLLKRGEAALFVLTILTAMSMPICAALAQQLPVEARFVPTLLLQQLGNWVLYWLVLAVPFLLGSAAIGLALMLAADRVALVYAANLAGSGIGAVLVTAAMYHVPPPWLPVLMGLLAIPGVAAVRCGSLDSFARRANKHPPV